MEGDFDTTTTPINHKTEGVHLNLIPIIMAKSTANSSKRKADQEEQPTTPPKKVVFVLCPGASSREPTELKTALQALGTARVLSKWKGTMPTHLNANVDLVLSMCNDVAKEFPDRSILLVGHSFGTRIIVTLLSEIDAGKRKVGSDVPETLLTEYAILESYPLYGPGKPSPSTDRAATLQKAPASLRCLFVSGDKDDFLDRRKNWRGVDAKIGEEALMEVVSSMPSFNISQIVMIPDGKHNALNAAKTKKEQVATTFQNAVRSFVGHFAELHEEEKAKTKSITTFFAPQSKKAKSK